ncbi:MAG: ATP-dependent helicase, partial [Chloroflexota bacterium]|nr:ATP-dependent helicase [Chloroflexota bacterium]
MHMIHGTWIPDDSREFVQRGAFYLWVETDTPVGAARRGADTDHPRHLRHTALATFLLEKLGRREVAPGALARTLCTKHFVLPTAAGKPLPSFELLRYVEEEVPVAYELAPWQVWCYPVPHVITALNDIQFIALHAAEDFQLGADLLFWQQYTQALKGFIAKDQYIPALKYRALPSGTGKRTKDAPAFELHPGWEFLSDAYEATIRRYAAAMPLVCAVGVNSPDDVQVFAREPFLRHFSECLLHDIVTETPFPAKFDQQIAGSLLSRCVYPHRPAPPQAPGDALEDYKRWLTWRAHLTHGQTDAGFTLCFRLEEAPGTDVGHWQLHFLVGARHDPSLKLSLAEYWPLTPQRRAEAVRPFGADFERRLLLALGHAARIYPTVWEGLATEHPTGCRLTLEEAFAFLKERAWVLEDAGYTVLVPAWWTPEGRRRAKLRLKTALRPATGAATSGTGHLSLDALIAYQYQLAIGGQVVSEEEWRQLVDAKTPLVQFRGQWMELDRDKMHQLLQFWQTHQHEAPALSLLDLLKAGAEAEDDLEWEHEPPVQDLLARLHDQSAFAPIADPPTLRGTLRDYQKRGVAWLQYLEHLGLNPCLADDM